MTRSCAASLVLAFCMTLGCGGDAPDLSGEYAGELLDDSLGRAGVRLTLHDVRDALSGTWRASGAGFLDRSYYVVGSHTGVAVELDVSLSTVSGNTTWSAAGICSYRLTGTETGSELIGTYSTHGCDERRTGRFSLQRQ
ncbi:MAG: hypothetical protein AB7O37_14455 [Vicinamibacteria bacterium]